MRNFVTSSIGALVLSAMATTAFADGIPVTPEVKESGVLKIAAQCLMRRSNMLMKTANLLA